MSLRWNHPALSNREKAARYDTVYEETIKLTDALAMAQGLELERSRRIRAANAGELIVEFPLISGEVSKSLPKEGLVEVNLGSDDGLKRGVILEVMRPAKTPGGSPVARIRLIVVERERAVGTLLPGNGAIQKGDWVFPPME